MLAEIKTEAARHCTVALFSEPFAWNPLYLFSPCSPFPLSLHLSLHLPLPLSPLSFPRSLFSLSSCLWCTYVVTFHWLFPLLCSYTQASGAFARQRQPLLRVLVMCASSVWSSVPFLPFHSYKRLKGGVTLLPCSFPQEGLKRDNKN